MSIKKAGGQNGHNSPILNGPYGEPQLHYATAPDGNLDYEDRRAGRRIFRPKRHKCRWAASRRPACSTPSRAPRAASHPRC